MTNLKELVNYKTGFSLQRTVTITVIVGSLLFSAIVAVFAFMYVKDQNSKVWVLNESSGQITVATTKTNTDKQRMAEYKNHIRMFYSNMYAFTEKSFWGNVENGLHMIGNSGKDILAKYQRENTQQILKDANVIVTVDYINSDSIAIDMSKTPRECLVHATQNFEANSGKSSRRLYAKFLIYDLDTRTEQNPHACLIDKWEIIDDTKIQVNE